MITGFALLKQDLAGGEAGGSASRHEVGPSVRRDPVEEGHPALIAIEHRRTPEVGQNTNSSHQMTFGDRCVHIR